MADTWDPAKDTADGNACRSYGAAGIMRVPGRLHISWQDDTTLKIETDAGTQTRLLHFTGTPGGEPSWQGYSAAVWEDRRRVGGGGGGGGAAARLRLRRPPAAPWRRRPGGGRAAAGAAAAARTAARRIAQGRRRRT